MELSIHRQTVVRTLFAIIMFLAIAGIASAIAKAHLAGSYWTRVLNRFDLDGNWNIPIWYSSLALLFAAGLIVLVAKATRCAGGPYVRRWYVLAAIFAMMSLDEAVGFHGMMNHPLRRYTLTESGGVFFPWVIPAMIFVMVVVIAYLPVVASLPKPVSRRIYIGGAVFVGGAVGMETLSGFALIYLPEHAWLYQACAITEEIMEKLGVLIFIDAMLLHLGSLSGRIHVHLKHAPPQHAYNQPQPRAGQTA